MLEFIKEHWVISGTLGILLYIFMGLTVAGLIERLERSMLSSPWMKATEDEVFIVFWPVIAPIALFLIFICSFGPLKKEKSLMRRYMNWLKGNK